MKSSGLKSPSASAKILRPLARADAYEIDTQLFVIDEKRQRFLGRARPVVLFDACCQGAYGVHIGFESRSGSAHMNAIRHGILPKTYVGNEYPDIENRWEFHGVAEVYNLDKSMAVYAQDFDRIGQALGATIRFDTPKQPWYKTAMNRFFRELNEYWLRWGMSTTFSNSCELGGDYNPMKNAVIPYSTLLVMLHKFIVDMHLQCPNREINDTPANKWTRFADVLPPRVPLQVPEQDVIFGNTLKRRFFRHGIEVNGLEYKSQELEELRRRLVRPYTSYPEVVLKSLPGDLGCIYVLDHQAKTYLMVPAVDHEYANGLNVWTHGLHLRYCRKYLGGRTDIHALSEAQAQIWERCLTAAARNDTTGRHVKVRGRLSS